MRKQAQTEYEKDFYAWAMNQSALIKSGRLGRMDLENIAEEIESLGNSNKKSLRSHLFNLLKHLLKATVQPEKHCSSWSNSITNSRRDIKYSLQDSPSLKPFIKEIFDSCYQDAREDAAKETGIKLKEFPKECPWTLKEILK